MNAVSATTCYGQCHDGEQNERVGVESAHVSPSLWLRVIPFDRLLSNQECCCDRRLDEPTRSEGGDRHAHDADGRWF